MQRIVKLERENTMRLLNEDMVDIYDRYFTTDDIEAFCTFYQSAAGKKLVDSTPGINQDVRVQSMTKYQPGLMKLVKEYFEESQRLREERYKD